MYLPNVDYFEGVVTPASIVLNGNLGPMQDEEFERRWAEIAEDLSDLEPAPEDLTEPESEDPDSRQSSGFGPRDWAPSEEEEEDEEDELDAVFDEVAAVARASKKQAPPSSRHSALLWIICAVALSISVLMAFSVIPGGGVVAGVLGIVGFIWGALAAFGTSSHGRDPFDDGARL
ncbi:hypothetical protein DD236_10910 [Ancrocorticia populi]|uniref:Uncharacterized protein n=2 Tax=Ancrocorticia populi TaxID=2175228 RepID=A0A2V1K011_9ACTO|nr:hypothetical protein DD236_10910 [Ancrocorticia populi]